MTRATLLIDFPDGGMNGSLRKCRERGKANRMLTITTSTSITLTPFTFSGTTPNKAIQADVFGAVAL